MSIDTTTTNHKITRTPRIRTIKLGDCAIDRESQRDATIAAVRNLADRFNPDLMGIPVVSYRDRQYWVLDGQHRILALKQVLGEDADDWDFIVECYEGLTESEEADMFLKLNNRKNVSAFDRFHVAVTAGYPTESDINRIVTSHGLRISQDKTQGSISAVSALGTVYSLGGPKLLSTTLSVTAAAWDSTVWDSFIVRGVGLFLNRFGKRIDDKHLIKALAAFPLGSKGVRMTATRIKNGNGVTLDRATAAAITDQYNKGRRGTNSLGNWFKGDEAAA